MHDTLATTSTSSRCSSDPMVLSRIRSMCSLIDESFSMKRSREGT